MKMYTRKSSSSRIVKNACPATKSIINNEKVNQFNLIKIKYNTKIIRKQAVERNICIQTT